MTVDAHTAIVAALQRRYVAPPLEKIKRPISHRQGLTARLTAIEAGRGSEKAAAEAAGVTLRTWRGWKRNPGAILARRSRAGVEQAYQDDWERRNRDPLRQMRYALAKARTAHPIIWAEMQWDGYYNGQGQSVGASQPAPPYADNTYAHRRVDFQEQDISSVVRAWRTGRDTRGPMEQLLSTEYSATIFLNSYFRNVSVDL